MIRPKRKDYLMPNGNYSFNYTEALEKYCDELERMNQSVVKALDNAFVELELSNRQLIELDRSFLPMTKEQWKEYLLKDDN